MKLAMRIGNNPLFTKKQLIQLLWPLIVEQFLSVLIGMVDVLMVASVGETTVSGVSLVDSINHLVIQVLFAMTAGGTVVCAQFIGGKDQKNWDKRIVIAIGDLHQHVRQRQPQEKQRQQQPGRQVPAAQVQPKAPDPREEYAVIEDIADHHA